MCIQEDTLMATKAINMKLDEDLLAEIRKIACVFNMTFSDAVREALGDYIEKMEDDPYYKLTANVEEASPEESEDILNAIGSLTDEDMEIASRKSFKVTK